MSLLPKPKVLLHLQNDFLEGEEVDFSRYKGKKGASGEHGLQVRLYPAVCRTRAIARAVRRQISYSGFSGNNFNQEKGSNEEIAEFCQKNYGVKFQMFEKILVKGDDQHPLYQWLSRRSSTAGTTRPLAGTSANTWSTKKENSLSFSFQGKAHRQGDS